MNLSACSFFIYKPIQSLCLLSLGIIDRSTYLSSSHRIGRYELEVQGLYAKNVDLEKASREKDRELRDLRQQVEAARREGATAKERFDRLSCSHLEDCSCVFCASFLFSLRRVHLNEWLQRSMS